MNTTPQPGLRGQRGVRNTFRVLGLVLLPLGAVLLVVGFVRFAGSDDWSGDGMPPGLLMFAGGGGLAVLGFGLVSAGFMGATARYGAGETMPVLKDSAAYLSDGRGVMGVGRTAADPLATAAGPFCRACGVRNDPDATFCDGCGQSIA